MLSDGSPRAHKASCDFSLNWGRSIETVAAARVRRVCNDCLPSNGRSGIPNFEEIYHYSHDLGQLTAGAVNPGSPPSAHNIWLYDVSDPIVTQQFGTIHETPGIARAVSIYNGLAYVADSEAGMQVINYLAYDNQIVFINDGSVILSTSSPANTISDLEWHQIALSESPMRDF